MSLFGRRKPGFSKEVELKPNEISGEFSDALDPAANRADNPKAEKIDMQQKASSVLSRIVRGENVEQGDPPGQPGEPEMNAPHSTVDLLDYMESLPEVEDPFPPSPPAEPCPAPEKTPAELLADFIRARTVAAQLTPLALIRQEDEHWEELLAQMAEIESCADIQAVHGERDTYYYSDATMAHNYAMIAAYIEDKDIPRTIAQMVRFNCKTYPAPTPLYYFMRHPYSYTKPQIDRALTELKRREGFSDIEETAAFNGVVYLFSTQSMSPRYAQALANGAEHKEGEE